MADDLVPWSAAWQEAATGPDGFYRSESGSPDRHFATRVMTGDTRARRIVDVALPSAGALRELTVTDVGAADATLLHQLIALWPADLMARTRWRGVDIRPRPAGADPRIEWIVADVASPHFSIEPRAGVVLAHELLDDIACDIVEPDDDGALRLILVHRASGTEEVGPRLADARACASHGVDSSALLSWCEQWWPRRQPAARIEVGANRDRAWAAITASVTQGLAIAVDYSHLRADRADGRWDGGTLAAYALGHPTSAVPDGSCNLTAHVALDSCAATAGLPTELIADGNDFRWLVQRIHGRP